jgi:hypothetical protein
MEIEEKIIKEIQKHLGDIKELDNDLLEKINKLIVFQSVMVTEKEKTDRDAINYIENKLYDFIEK